MTNREIVEKAVEAANLAGDEWLANATTKYEFCNTDLQGNQIGPGYLVLDLCGNAHVQFRDKRSKDHRRFLKEGLLTRTDNGVIDINHKHRSRQEFGLAEACAKAAMKVLEENGITGLRIWSYID